jgi:hypothetical protein
VATAYATTTPINGRKNRLDLTLFLNTPRMQMKLSIRPQPHFSIYDSADFAQCCRRKMLVRPGRLTHGVSRKRHSRRSAGGMKGLASRRQPVIDCFGPMNLAPAITCRGSFALSRTWPTAMPPGGWQTCEPFVPANEVGAPLTAVVETGVLARRPVAGAALPALAPSISTTSRVRAPLTAVAETGVLLRATPWLAPRRQCHHRRPTPSCARVRAARAVNAASLRNSPKSASSAACFAPSRNSKMPSTASSTTPMQTQSPYLDQGPQQNHRRRQARAPSVRFDPLSHDC